MNKGLMKIGDEVAFHHNDGRPDTVVVITHIGEDGFIDGMDAKGTLYASKNPQKWTKTGRHFPLVKLLLMQMDGQVTSDDMISRQEAIEAIFNEPLCESGMKEKTAIEVVLAIYKKIESLPSAQTLTAYITSDEDGNIKCSNCGSSECWGNYCMNRGAKMRGKNNGRLNQQTSRD